ncbi:RND family efflux transporter, MFP subunit [Muriicola jejuensis]|uniref:Efflux RND transporter periplasmic adaptor subunit n=1 Tax=Muriicola jejuensis TaxID=504488 RepID=A0A6P0UCV6_9FLAO|nr:efflux RND transporter periplasmic adaptor subunit [Muriicola jejuensis]NER09739.1 efflux RND transporter periplasmic adaptor subunit [Muriicola jejuensis]SMP06124.1 RND family efflux transporter, MFP subunit [Muriicola jejuensis]
MKTSIPILTLFVLLISCGGDQNESLETLIANGDLEAIRSKKSSLSEEMKSISDQVKALDSVIAILDADTKLPLVNTFEVNSGNFEHFLELQGDVATKQNVLIYPEMAGTLERVYVTEGDKVVKGQLLASIDHGGMANQLEQLKAQAALAETTYERQKRLWEQNIGSEIQYLQAKTSYEASRNSVQQVERQLAKSAIRAPFSGIIDDVIKDQGTVVAPGPGSEVFRIVNLSNMYLTVDVPETYVGSIDEGTNAKVYFPVLGDSVQTRVRQAGNHINPNNRSFTVEIPVPNESGTIKPNLSARVLINDYTNPEALLVPQSVISENAEGEQYVFIAENPTDDMKGTARKRVVVTGMTQGRFVEILNGLQPGELIIQEGARSVKDNQDVQIIK